MLCLGRCLCISDRLLYEPHGRLFVAGRNPHLRYVPSSDFCMHDGELVTVGEIVYLYLRLPWVYSTRYWLWA